MKHDTPTPDERAAYLQDADDLERAADKLEAQGLSREALHLRSEAEQVRAEAPPRYTVRRGPVRDLWTLAQGGAGIGTFMSEATARAVAHACNIYDVAGLDGASDVATLRRLRVEKLERQVADLRQDTVSLSEQLDTALRQVRETQELLDAERRQARSNLVDGQRFGG